MPVYQALSTQQPWANLIRDGLKTIETRIWATAYRGDLLICASRLPAIAPSGCAVCLVELSDCRPMQLEDWAAACLVPYGADVPGRATLASLLVRRHRRRPPPRVVYGWHLVNVRPVPPVPVRGQVRIFAVRLPDLLRRR